MKATQIINKKVRLSLEMVDRNIFSIFAAFRAQALTEGWTIAEVGRVINVAKDGNYAHALRTIQAHVAD